MKLPLAIFSFLAISFAAEDIDTAITQKLEFYSQMEVVQNLEIAQHYETLVAEDNN
jgi:hypothetical protein